MRFPSLKTRLRHHAFGVATVLGLAPRGFFIPHAQAAGIARPVPPYPGAAAALAAAAPAFRDTLAAVEAVAADLLAIKGGAPPAPRYDQGWFPTLDAAVLYALVRRHRPARLVEVGSGHSTRFAARAIADGGLATRLTAIDPAPRRALDGLAATHLPAPVQEADPAVFTALAPGDLLVVDGSHILMPGSDLDHLLNRVLPELPAGVLVHVHDIFLPDDYPASWWWRGYNEQSAIAPLLAPGGGWRPVFASHYAATRLGAALAAGVVARLPAAVAPPSSLWLVRTDPGKAK